MAAPRARAAAVATTTQVVEVELSPKAKKELAMKLGEFLSLHSAIKDLNRDKAKLVGEIEAIYVREKEGHALDAGTTFEGIKLKKVGGTTSKLNKKKFVSLGGSLAILERATETKPRKPYLKVTPAGEEDGETDS